MFKIRYFFYWFTNRMRVYGLAKIGDLIFGEIILAKVMGTSFFSAKCQTSMFKEIAQRHTWHVTSPQYLNLIFRFRQINNLWPNQFTNWRPTKFSNESLYLKKSDLLSKMDLCNIWKDNSKKLKIISVYRYTTFMHMKFL